MRAAVQEARTGAKRVWPTNDRLEQRIAGFRSIVKDVIANVPDEPQVRRDFLSWNETNSSVIEMSRNGIVWVIRQDRRTWALSGSEENSLTIIRQGPTGRREKLYVGSYSGGVLNEKKFYPDIVYYRWTKPTSSDQFGRPVYDEVGPCAPYDRNSQAVLNKARGLLTRFRNAFAPQEPPQGS